MTYAFIVTVERGNNWDRYVFTVAATNASQAIAKAMRQAQRDSGYKKPWAVTELKRGGWLVS